jgi:hypothetical protein
VRPFTQPLLVTTTHANSHYVSCDAPVIFLRATHDELTKAGYTNLDPKHELFLTHRPHQDAGSNEAIPDAVLLSPRGQMLSPRPLPRLGAIEITEKPLKLRQGVALTSKPIGVISKGTRLRVVDSRVWSRDGTQRVCVAAADDEAAILPMGWVTIQPPTQPSTRPSSWSSTPMAEPQPETAANLIPAYVHALGRDLSEEVDAELDC